jgi:tetratricopeptide (TPR) repeat protein
MDNPLWLCDEAPPEIFFQVLLRLGVDDLWRYQRVCVAWRSLLVSDSFWVMYCNVREWDYRKGLAVEIAARRKMYIAFVGSGPLTVRFWARKVFFREQRDRMFETSAVELMRDGDLRRRFGHDIRGFLDCVLAVDEKFGPALNKRALLSFDEGKYEAAKEDLEQCVKHNIYFSDAISNLGLAFHELGMLEKAFKMYSVAISIEGDEISLNVRGSVVFGSVLTLF